MFTGVVVIDGPFSTERTIRSLSITTTPVNIIDRHRELRPVVRTLPHADQNCVESCGKQAECGETAMVVKIFACSFIATLRKNFRKVAATMNGSFSDPRDKI